MTDHNSDGMLIPAGFHTDLNVDRAFKFVLPKPYSSCEIHSESSKTSGSDLFKLIAKSRYEYTQQLCIMQCYQQEVIEKCNCTDTAFSLFDTHNCVTNEEAECLSNTFTKEYQTSDFLLKKCLPLCPLECNKTEYKTTLTTSRLMGDIYAKYIEENPNLARDFLARPIDADTARESVTSLGVFYDTLSYTISTETPQMNIACLLAAIGGNLGLFMGVSLLSVCELVEIGIEMCFTRHQLRIEHS